MCNASAAMAGSGAGMDSAKDGLAIYAQHQNWSAQKYVNEVRTQITQQNAEFSNKVASQGQSETESSDRTAEGVDTLVAKVNALKTRSSLKVAQGENGATGTTQGDILSEADRITAAREGILSLNYKSRLRERLNQRWSISASYLNNRSGGNSPFLPNPTSLGALGLDIAGHGLNAFADYQQAQRQGASNAQQGNG